MSEQSTVTPVFFQPLPEHDNLNTSYFLARFSEHIIVTQSGCWEWTGSKVGAGYGRVSLGGRNQIAHRLIYKLCVSPVSDKTIEVCHNCPGGDNPSCCNPAHLFLGSHTENVRDCAKKGRIKAPNLKGEQHPHSRFTNDAIRDIRRRAATKEKGIIRVLAEEYHTSKGTISGIANRKRWVHVSDEPEGGAA